jgi:thiamine pyrophosphate-dependent acetolactate synthase large subunit-like protein
MQPSSPASQQRSERARRAAERLLTAAVPVVVVGLGIAGGAADIISGYRVAS